jgi:uncharacterized protein (TIGR02271 family)
MSKYAQPPERNPPHPTLPSQGHDADERTRALAAEPDSAGAPAPLITSAHATLNPRTVDAEQAVNVPVIEEQISVQKRLVETGQVVIHVEPRVEQQVLEVPLLEDAVEVERVAINRFVDGPTPVREEGDVTVVPVFEEVLVVQKRLMLKEEIRLVRRRVATIERQTFDVRKEEVHVLRAGALAAASNDSDDESARSGTHVAKPKASAEGGRS